VVRDSINDRELGQWSVLGSVGDCFFVPSVWVIIGPRTEASIHKRRIGLISCRYKYVMCEQTRGSTRVADTRSCFVIRRLLITIANRHGRVVTGANEICRSILRRTPVTLCIYKVKAPRVKERPFRQDATEPWCYSADKSEDLRAWITACKDYFQRNA
jgi:hypothetical protein